MNRRNFTLFSLASLASFAAGGFALKGYEPRAHLRPPGAVENFASLCVKCGQCVQVCPYHSIFLLGLDDGVNSATAAINAKERGCYLCDLFPCVLACPSGALNHNTTTIADVKMGEAVVINQANCVALKNLSEADVAKLLSRKAKNEREEAELEKIRNNINSPCRLCENACPVENALKITEKLEIQILPNCVGCGVCAEVCFKNVIEIIPKKGSFL